MDIRRMHNAIFFNFDVLFILKNGVGNEIAALIDLLVDKIK